MKSWTFFKRSIESMAKPSSWLHTIPVRRNAHAGRFISTKVFCRETGPHEISVADLDERLETAGSHDIHAAVRIHRLHAVWPRHDDSQRVYTRCQRCGNRSAGPHQQDHTGDAVAGFLPRTTAAG